MPLSFYKANSSMKGHACGLSFNSKDNAYYISLAKQDGWNGKVGSFKNGKKCSVKLSPMEMGELVHCLERNKALPKPFFHTSPKGTTNINFAPYMVAENNTQVQKGWGLAIFKTEVTGEKATFTMSFNFGEAVMIREHLKFALQHIYTAIYSEDKKNAQNYLEKREGNPAAKTAEQDDFSEPQEAPQTAVDDDGWGN